MSSTNALYAHFEEVTVTDIPALFTPERIDRATVPTGMFQYEIRHADEDWGNPCQLAKGVMVNFYGTILTSNPIQLGADGKLDFEPSQFMYEDSSEAVTIPQYLGKHPAFGRGCMELAVASEQRMICSFPKARSWTEKMAASDTCAGTSGAANSFIIHGGPTRMTG